MPSCVTTAASSSVPGPANRSSTAPSRSVRRCSSPAPFASIMAASSRRASSSFSPMRMATPIRSRRGKVLPVYPATEGLSHKIIRSLIDRHLDGLIALSADIIPEGLRRSLELLSIPEALRAVHRPATVEEAEAGRRRLAFDELLDLQLMLIRARTVAKRQRSGIAFEVKRQYTTRLRETLPWELTQDQQRAIREITADMTAPDRMHRLLMGDVGTGKTVVALFAMLLAAENDFQSALMAPTELLAEQHAATLARLLAPLEIRPEMLLGRQTAAEKAAVRARLASGQSRLVVGTHALMQESVSFRRLGLVDHRRAASLRRRAAGRH